MTVLLLIIIIVAVIKIKGMTKNSMRKSNFSRESLGEM